MNMQTFLRWGLLVTLVTLFQLTFAQQKINLQVKNASLTDVLNKIRLQSDYDFVYTSRHMALAKPITLDIRNQSIENILEASFKNQPLTYSISEKTITVKFKEEVSTSKSVDDAIQQTKIREGIVIDREGNGIAGVSIRSTTIASHSVSGKDGKFLINLPEKEAGTLEFTYLGMEKITYVVPKSGNLRVVLAQETKELEELVVTGYQVLKRSDVAGAISSINAKDLTLTGFNSLEQALQGKMPGMVITNESGQVGMRQRTRVRGTSTLVGSQDPVWVVDGIIQEDPLPFKTAALNLNGESITDNFDYIRNYIGNSISWLNPMDIEDVTVLKDAAATAIYGIRAANGVIVITTKKGGSGTATINYNYGMNIAERIDYDRLDLMNSKDRVAVSREIFQRGLVGPSLYNNNIGYAGALKQYLDKQISAEEFNDRVKTLETNNTDWFDILFRTPFSMNHNLSFSGGTDKVRLYNSLAYNDTKGTAIGNQSKTVTGNMNANVVFNKKLNLSARISGSNSKTNGFYLTDPYSYASRMNRAMPAYDQDGELYYYAGVKGYLFNIINERDQTGNVNRTTQINSSLNLNYDIIKGLRFNTLFSFSVSNSLGESYATERTEYIANEFRGYDYGTVKPNTTAYINSKLPAGGLYNSSDLQSSAVNWRNSLNYSNVFANKHAVTFMLGQELSSSLYNGFGTTQYGYLRDRGKTFANIPVTFTSANIANDLNQKIGRVLTDRKTNSVGVYLTTNYTYDSRYVFNFSVRTDASNRFGQFTNERFNPIWAGGLRWNVSQEKWFQQTDWLSNLALRSSWGYQRNIAANVGPNLILKIPSGTGSSSIDVFTGENLLEIYTLPYGDLRWEKNQSTNLGADLSLFTNRVNMTLDFYSKKGRDLLSTLNIPLEYGMANMIVNGGSMDNKGLELSLSFMPIRKKDYNLTVGFNTSKNINKITKNGLINRHWSEAASGAYYKEGYPVSGFWAFDFEGINPENGHPIINLDVDPDAGDPLIDPTTYMKYVGRRDPDLTGGFNLNFRYKQFAINTSAYLQLGGKRFLAPAYTMVQNLPTEYENLSNELLARWTPENTSATFPGLPDQRVTSALLPNNKTYSNVYTMYNYSTARVVNASTLRFNTISLNYFVPENIFKRLGCKNASLAAVMTNPFAIVSKDFKGRDAEVAQGAQPRTRMYSMSVNLSF